MTVGKLMELLGGKAGVLDGRFHYGTGLHSNVPFKRFLASFIEDLFGPVSNLSLFWLL